MSLAEKFYSTALSIIPVPIIVIALHFTAVPLPAENLLSFLLGSFFITTGLTFFLHGMELGIMPVGSFLGGALNRTKRISVILIAGAVIGFLITIAEPNLAVLGRQAEETTGILSSNTIIFAVAAGVAAAAAIALVRTVLQIPFKLIIIFIYGLSFFFAAFAEPIYVSIAFDSGGAATGPLTVPFIIALGIGAASVRGDKSAHDDNFGYTGLVAAGPIAALTAYAFILTFIGKQAGTPSAFTAKPDAQSLTLLNSYFNILCASALNTAVSIIPFAGILLLFQFLLLKLPPFQLRKIILGIVYSYIGLVIFFLGTDSAFIPVSNLIGSKIGSLSFNWILIPIGGILGAVVVCAEPSAWALIEQVEELSEGNIRKPIMLFALAAGTGLFVGIAMFRILFNFNIWYLLIPFYSAVFILTIFTPRLFTCIAFDSGSVASGPMSSAFVLSLGLGAASASTGSSPLSAFGLIAMTSLSPLITIQILGCIFEHKQKKQRLKLNLSKENNQ